MRYFIKPDLFDNSVSFDNTTPIYLIKLRWKLGIGLGLDLKLHNIGSSNAECLVLKLGHHRWQYNVVSDVSK